MKKAIVVPTDFSDNALIAAQYALQFAKHQGYEVHLLHSYLPFSSAFQNPKANEKDEDRAKQTAEREMSNFLKRLSPREELNTTPTIQAGNLVDTLSQFIEERAIALVIMGTHGTSGTRKDVLGSNTYDVAESISIPLIVVPEHITEFRLDSVVFFTDYQSNDIRTLSAFKNLVSDQEKRCTLVHIVSGTAEDIQQHQLKLEEWKEHLKNQVGYEFLESHLVSEKENLEKVNTIVDQMNADLTLLTLVEGRGFFEKLFHKSLAREIVLNPKRPVFLNAGTEFSFK